MKTVKKHQIFGRLRKPDVLVLGEGLCQPDRQVVLEGEQVVMLEHDGRDVNLKIFMEGQTLEVSCSNFKGAPCQKL